MKNQFPAEIADEVKEFLFLLSNERQRLLKEGPASIVRLDESSQILQLWQKTLKSKQHDLRCSEKLFSLPHNSYTDLLRNHISFQPRRYRERCIHEFTFRFTFLRTEEVG